MSSSEIVEIEKRLDEIKSTLILSEKFSANEKIKLLKQIEELARLVSSSNNRSDSGGRL